MICRYPRKVWQSLLILINLQLHIFSKWETVWREKLTYPGCLLETELEVRVGLEAGDEDAVEGNGGGHRDAGEEGGGQCDGALSCPAAISLHQKQHSRLKTKHFNGTLSVLCYSVLKNWSERSSLIPSMYLSCKFSKYLTTMKIQIFLHNIAHYRI